MKILSNENMKILKYETIKQFRHSLQIKWENIFLPLAIPCIISQLINAQEGMKMIAIVMILLLFGAVWYGIKDTRKEILKEVKQTEKKLKKELDCIKKEVIQATEQSSSTKTTIIQSYFQDNFYNRL